MKKTKIVITALLLFYVVIVGLAACGDQAPQEAMAPEQEETVEAPAEAAEALGGEEERAEIAELNLAYTIVAEGGSVLDASIFIELMEEKYNIEATVVLLPGGGGEYEMNLRTLITSGDIPDIFWSRASSFAEPYITGGIVQPIGELLEIVDQNHNIREIFHPFVFTTYSMVQPEHIFALQLEQTNYNHWLYNREYFEQLGIEMPKVFSDIEPIVELMRTEMPDVAFMASGIMDGWNASMVIEGFACTIDPEIIMDLRLGNNTFSNSAWQRGAELAVELIEMGAFPTGFLLEDEDSARARFANGGSLFLSGGTWNVGDAIASLGNENVGLTYFPVASEEYMHNFMVSTNGGPKPDAGLFIATHAPEPEIAMLVAVEFVINQNRVMFEQNGLFTVPTIVQDDWEFGNLVEGQLMQMPTPNVLVQLMADSSSFLPGQRGLFIDDAPTTIVADALMTHTFSLFAGEITVEEYCRLMDEAAAMQ